MPCVFWAKHSTKLKIFKSNTIKPKHHIPTNHPLKAHRPKTSVIHKLNVATATNLKFSTLFFFLFCSSGYSMIDKNKK